MNMDENYKKFAERHAPKSPIVKDCLMAFWVGGLICVIGQAFSDFYKSRGASEETVKMLVPVTLIFLAALFTGLGVFDRIAKHAGAGTLVPITGFANGVASSAIEYKKEGQVFGIGCKIFTIAGPAILYGLVCSWALGLLYWIGLLFGARIV